MVEEVVVEVAQEPEDLVRAEKERAKEVPYQFAWNCLRRSLLPRQCKIPSSYTSQTKVLPTLAQCLKL